MQTGEQIIARFRDVGCDTDLGMIYDLWPDEDCGSDALRSTDHLAIRRAASALDRVGGALIQRLALDGAAEYRALPMITPATRVRKTPQRFWLEIDLGGEQIDWADRSVLFIEFSKSVVRFGIRFPANGAPLGKGTKKALRQYSAADQGDQTAWLLEQRKAPAAPKACSTDVNMWLAGRYVSQQQGAEPLALSRISLEQRPLTKALVAGLLDASSLMEAVTGDDMIIEHPLSARQAQFSAAKI
ncbi:hypothetical protein [Sulfitobacter sp.]|uniref:hypothetical protein n=1 Tax=Sulfitobacter sp. TaxID=1903071 RepID=UPI0030037977